MAQGESFVYTACPGWGDHDYCALKTIVKDGKIVRTERVVYSDPEEPDGCILIQMAGDARLNNQKFKATFHHKGKMLPAEEALRITGHAVGGVCGFAIDNEKVRIYCDESLKRFDTVFPAAGSGNSAIELTCDELFRYSGALEWIDVTRLPEEAAQ